MVSLKNLITTVKTTPVSIGFLRERLPPNCDVVNYKRLRGKHRTDVFKNKRAVVILVPKKGEKMGHFVVCIPRKHHIELFSSLGGDYKSELAALNEPTDVFDKLLGNSYIYNRTPLQSKSDYSVEDCASWVLARCFLSRLKMREFVSLFKGRVSLQNPDDIVSLMTLLHFTNLK